MNRDCSEGELRIRDLRTLVADIRQALASGDAGAILSVIGDLGLQLGLGGQFTPEEFQALTEVLTSPEAVGSAHSYPLFLQVENLWVELTQEQQGHALRLLEEQYPKLTDWIAQLAITDVLAYCPPPESGLAILRRLRAGGKGSEPARAVLANGFGLLATTSPTPTVKSQALRELLAMRRDASEVVRLEAEDRLVHVIATVSKASADPLYDELVREGLLGKTPS